VVQIEPPAGAIVSRADIEGRKLIQDKPEGQPFFASDLGPAPPRPALAATVPLGRLLTTVRIGSMDIPVPELFAGDRLDLLQATPEGVRLVAGDAQVMGSLSNNARAQANADNGRILGIDISIPDLNARSDDSGLALVLAVLPADVYAITAAEASGKKMKVVLHSDQEVRSGKLINLRPIAPPPPAPGPPAPSVEVLLGGRIERVYF
jgi:hypothetical protein